MKYKQYDFESFRILTIQSNHFKNVHMEINFVDDVENISMPIRSFLTNLISYTTLKYPTKRELLIALEELYNSSYYSTCSRVGHTFFSTFLFDFLSPRYVNEKNYLEKCVQFFCEQVMQPNIKDGKFDERSINIIKESKHSSIDRYKENALSYALKKSRDFLFANSITSKPLDGTHEDIEAITNEDLVNDYQKLFQDSSVDILIVGDLDMDEVVAYFQKYFQKKSIVEKQYTNVIDNAVGSLKELEVQGKYVQTQLILYLQYESLTDFELFAVSKLYLTILGSANQSDKLTQYLRILNPLVYRNAVCFVPTSKYILINASLNYKNIEEAKRNIYKAILEMEKGMIDENYFEVQKEKILSNMTMYEDDESYLIEEYYFHVLFNHPLSSEKRELIQKVTIEDVQKFAQKLQKTLIYVLKEVE